MIRTVLAREVRPGDVMANNGARVDAAVLCQGGGPPDEVCICEVYGDGEQRFSYVSPDLLVHLYVEDGSDVA